MESEADREPEEDRPRRRALSMEDLKKKYPWWPSKGAKEGQPKALIDIEAGDGEGTALRGIKSTKL